MKLLVTDYPTSVRTELRRLYPYRDSMQNFLIENGYKPTPYFDVLLLKVGQILNKDFNVEGMEGSFWSDLWDKVKTPFDVLQGILQSAGVAVEGIIQSAGNLGAGTLAGVQNKLQNRLGGANPDDDKPEESNEWIWLILVAAVIGYLIYKNS